MDQNAASFLKERLRQQAHNEGMVLSADEDMCLELMSAGRTQEAGEVIKRLKEHESIQEFGSRLAGLFMRAYQQDCYADPQAKARYLQLFESLSGHSHLLGLVLPLIVGGRHQQHGARQEGSMPVRPASSFKPVIWFVVFLLAGLLLWMMMNKR